MPDDHLVRFVVDIVDRLDLRALVIAKELDTLKVGTVSPDGTKIRANTGKHKALRSPTNSRRFAAATV